VLAGEHLVSANSGQIPPWCSSSATRAKNSQSSRGPARAHATYATSLAREAIDLLYQASGASAIQAAVPIQRYQRDIQALANHAFLTASTSLELFGRGLRPRAEHDLHLRPPSPGGVASECDGGILRRGSVEFACFVD
jgi:hypothetical protein